MAVVVKSEFRELRLKDSANCEYNLFAVRNNKLVNLTKEFVAFFVGSEGKKLLNLNGRGFSSAYFSKHEKNKKIEYRELMYSK